MVQRAISPSFAAVVVATGFSGIVVQTVLLRELLIVFAGNELSIGVIIGNWVLWEALGAYLGGRIANRLPTPAGLVTEALLLFAALSPAMIYLVRVFKVLAGIPAEVGVGIQSIFSASLLLLMPTGLLHGLAFTACCSIGTRSAGPNASPTGTIYSLDALGTLAGGILVTFLLLPFLHSFQIAILTGAACGAACLCFCRANGGKGGAVLKGLSAALTASALLALATGVGDRLHDDSIGRQWRGKGILSYENSRYQNIVVTRTDEQQTFYVDGLPGIVSPIPDIAFVEEFVHFAMAAQPNPERVLVLHGGVGGIINEILKYPSVKAVDYVEIDPGLLKAVLRNRDRLTTRELSDRRVTLHFTDPRLFVRNLGARAYDVIFLGLRSPQTLQTNRLFTKEFFRSVRGSMKEHGLFAFALPGSLSYYTEELRDLNASMIGTLTDVFPAVDVIPGDANIMLASPSRNNAAPSPRVMMERLAAAGVDAALMTPPHLAYRLDAERRTWFQTQMTGSPARRNSDMVPSTLTYALSYENLIFSPSLKGLFVAVRSISLNGVLLICAALCLFCLVLNGRSPPRALASSVLTTGFAAMVLEVLLLFVFQVFQGYVFYAVGLLVAVFMAGLACGGCAGDRLTRGAANPGRLFLGCETALTTSALLVMAFLFLAERGLCSSATALNSAMGSLLFIIGFLTGCEFPLAAAAYWSGQTHGAADRAGGRAAGVVYALDLFGGWFGGIAGALFLFPVLGAYGCCITVAALKGATLIPLALSLRK